VLKWGFLMRKRMAVMIYCIGIAVFTFSGCGKEETVSKSVNEIDKKVDEESADKSELEVLEDYNSKWIGEWVNEDFYPSRLTKINENPRSRAAGYQPETRSARH